MFVELSENVTNAVMVTGSLKSLLNGGFIYLYSGPIPATADEAVDGSCVMLGKISESDDGVTGLTFEATADNGILKKKESETWETTFGASGTITFGRFCVGADDGSGVAGPTDYRVQGPAGTDMSFFFVLTSTAAVATESLTLDDLELQQPTLQQ